MLKIKSSLLGKIAAVATAFAAIFCAAACGGNEKPAEGKVEIILNKTEIEIEVGETFRLTATVKPEDINDKLITWRSADESIAMVDDGVVTGKKAGETTVTAQTNEKTVSCKVKVKEKKDSASDSSDSSDSSSSGSASDSSSSSGSGASDGSSGADSSEPSDSSSIGE